MYKYWLMLAFIAKAVKENLNKPFRNEEASKYAEIWVKLHKGNPGTEGLNEAAAETKRKKITWTALGEILKNSAALKWEGVSNTETYKYVSFWTLETGGTFLGYAQLETEQPVTAGQNAEIPVEGLQWKPE